MPVGSDAMAGSLRAPRNVVRLTASATAAAGGSERGDGRPDPSCRRPGGLAISSAPSSVSTRSSSPRARCRARDPRRRRRRPRPRRRSRRPPRPRRSRRAPRCVRVLDDVRERLGGDVVRSRLDRGREALGGHVDVDRERRAQHERLERRPQATVGEDVGMQASRQLPELLERLGSSARAVEDLRGLSASSRASPRRAGARARAPRAAAARRRGGSARAAGAPRRSRDDPAARGADLLLLALALRDVRAGDEDARRRPTGRGSASRSTRPSARGRRA